MDENTRMMIQLSSMMMANEKEIKEAQKQLGSPEEETCPKEGTADDKKGTEAESNKESKPVSDPKNLTHQTMLANPFLGMDPKLMTEFAKQIMLNATTASHRNSPLPLKKVGNDKPATIAQIIQSQNALNSKTTTAKDSSEGKIFVYNNIKGNDVKANGDVVVKQEVLSTSPIGNGSRVGNHRTQRRGNIAPFRNRHGRILRPGIDNFGSFESVANPGLIMHAMELLRQKDKKKRGPKEKETFSVFIYCLPDKNSKLPKFSSLDPLERSLVDQHQQEGYDISRRLEHLTNDSWYFLHQYYHYIVSEPPAAHPTGGRQMSELISTNWWKTNIGKDICRGRGSNGYPAQDYINGIPRKTQLCLTFNEEKFHSFMIAIFPKLEGRLYDMYRIDKTRRLIRVEAKSPRQLKDMKYQGSVIVIPYTNLEDRPAPVIHRNFDDCYSNSTNNNSSPLLGNPLNLIQNFRIPLPSLPELVSEATEISEEDIKKELAVLQGMPLALTKKSNKSSVNSTSSCDEMDYDSETSDTPSRNGHVTENLFDAVKILKTAAKHRRQLKPKIQLHIRPESIFSDMLNAYRTDDNLIYHKLSVCFQFENEKQHGDVIPEEDLNSGSVFVMFWEEAMRKHFTGNQDMVPVLDPNCPDDCFQVLGKILVHGLVLYNYLPLKFSPACLTQLITGSSSDRLLLTSFYRVMSDSEKEVLENAMEEVKMGLQTFSPIIENSIKIVLGIYGSSKPPQPPDLDLFMISVAKSYLVHQPYWALEQIRSGMHSCGDNVFSDVSDGDVLLLYQILTPHVPTLLERVVYLYPEEGEAQQSSKYVQKQFEQYLYKLPKQSLLKLLYQWCGFDCLCITELFVKFTETPESTGSIFNPQKATVYLPVASTSVVELQGVFENYLPLNWEYTL